MMLKRLLFVGSVAMIAAFTASPALAFNFDWNSIGWSNGTTSLQTFNNVDGSGINVSVEVTGDTGQLTNSTPALYDVGGNNELRLFPNFATDAQSVTVIFNFSQPVALKDLTIKDIDSAGYSDAVRIEGFRTSGLDVSPNDLSLGSNISQTSNKDFESAAATSVNYTDQAGWVTAGFSADTLVDRLEITHYSGALAPANPSGQAITISDFEFFTTLPVSVVKTADTLGPVAPGDTIEYTVTITNNSTDTLLSDIVVQDALSSLVSYTDNSTSATAFGAQQFVSASHTAISTLSGGSNWTGAWQIIDASAHGTIAAVSGVGLQLNIVPGVYDTSAPTIERVAQSDLSSATSLVLEFDLTTSGVNGGDFLLVYASSDGGASWNNVGFYRGNQPGAKSIDVSAYASANSAVQFYAVGREPDVVSNEYFAVDNINLIETTQGALTKDNNAGPYPLTSGIPPNLVETADALDIPPLASASITYSVDVGTQLDFNIANQAGFTSNEYPDPRSDTLVIPMAVASECDGTFTGNIRIKQNDDDGWWDDGSPKFSDDEYELGKTGGSPENTAGVRFRNITIPAGATAISATLTFTSSSDDTGNNPSVNVRAVDSADAPGFGGSPPGSLTAANVDWNLGDWTKDQEYSVDVGALLEELVTSYSGLDKAAVAFTLTATGDIERKAYDWSNNPNTSAKLSGSFECPSNTDSSDAPVGYGQATHNVPASPDIYIGSVAPDVDATDLASAAADGDDNDNIDDEDGVTFTSPAGSNQSIIANVTVANGSGGNVTLCGWLDRPDGTIGSFASSDGNCQSTAGGTVQLTWSNLPTDQIYATFARFRVSSDALTTGDWAGPASDGEVEDYAVEFDFTPTAVTIGRVDLLAAPVSQVLANLGVDSMARDEVAALLEEWSPGQAQLLVDADRTDLVDALVSYLDPDADGAVAVMYWDTLEERGTVGFYVERRSNRGNDWQRVNDYLLPGLITAPMGGEYQLADPSARAGINYEYRLIELEARGSTRTYGPFTLQFE